MLHICGHYPTKQPLHLGETEHPTMAARSGEYVRSSHGMNMLCVVAISLLATSDTTTFAFTTSTTSTSLSLTAHARTLQRHRHAEQRFGRRVWSGRAGDRYVIWGELMISYGWNGRNVHVLVACGDATQLNLQHSVRCLLSVASAHLATIPSCMIDLLHGHQRRLHHMCSVDPEAKRRFV